MPWSCPYLSRNFISFYKFEYVITIITDAYSVEYLDNCFTSNTEIILWNRLCYCYQFYKWRNLVPSTNLSFSQSYCMYSWYQILAMSSVWSRLDFSILVEDIWSQEAKTVLLFHTISRTKGFNCHLTNTILLISINFPGFPGGSVVKNPPVNAGDVGSIPGSGRPPGEGNGNPLQYSWSGDPMDRGAW